MLLMAGIFTMVPSFVNKVSKETSQTELTTAADDEASANSDVSALSTDSLDTTIYNGLSVYVINSATDLASVAAKVNNGETGYASANYYLKNDEIINRVECGLAYKSMLKGNERILKKKLKEIKQISKKIAVTKKGSKYNLFSGNHRKNGLSPGISPGTLYLHQSYAFVFERAPYAFIIKGTVGKELRLAVGDAVFRQASPLLSYAYNPLEGIIGQAHGRKYLVSGPEVSG